MRAIYLLAALVISAQAHADTTYPVSRTIHGGEYYLLGDSTNCIPLGSPLSGPAPCGGVPIASGGSGGINTPQQVLDAKQLIDDMAEKQKAKDELAKSSADTVTVVLGKLLPIQTCSVTPEGFNNGILNYCGPPTVKVSRQLIIDALQSQIDDDKAKLSAMGIKQ